VMVDGDQCHLIRERESLEQLTAQERILPQRTGETWAPEKGG
jgi:diaminopimelate decarboxylase